MVRRMARFAITLAALAVAMVLAPAGVAAQDPAPASPAAPGYAIAANAGSPDAFASHRSGGASSRKAGGRIARGLRRLGVSPVIIYAAFGAVALAVAGVGWRRRYRRAKRRRRGHDAAARRADQALARKRRAPDGGG
jgi:hypothetical protein